MILIGHALIAHEPFYAIQTSEDIAKTPSNAPLVFHFDAVLCDYCQKNQLVFALHVKRKKLKVSLPLWYNDSMIYKELQCK